MPIMKSQILESVDFTKTQKPIYLKNKTLFSPQIKKFINYTSRTTLSQKTVLYQRQHLTCHTKLLLNDYWLPHPTHITA